MLLNSALKIAAASAAVLVASTTVATSAQAFWFNTVNINQIGIDNAVAGSQTGVFNHIDWQDGAWNTAVSTGWRATSPSASPALVTAYGDQFGTATSPDRSGSGHYAETNQSGDCNAVAVLQFGLGQSTTANQSAPATQP